LERCYDGFFYVHWGILRKMGAGLTLRELADLLDPPVTVQQVEHMIRAVGLEPCGKRRSGRRGRPAALYEAKIVMELHAVLVPFLNGHRAQQT
jgi:hypothetical protein